jgi:hypothetical protein
LRWFRSARRDCLPRHSGIRCHHHSAADIPTHHPATVTAWLPTRNHGFEPASLAGGLTVRVKPSGCPNGCGRTFPRTT